MDESEKSIDFDLTEQPNSDEKSAECSNQDDYASIHKSERIFDLFLFLGGILFAMMLVLVLFNLKWRQAAGDFGGSRDVNVSETYAEPVDEAIEEELANDFAEGIESEEDTVAEEISEEPEEETEITGLYAGEDDVIYYLGTHFGNLQKKYCESEQILGAESHYFMDEYLAVVYDNKTMEILCLESDGPGKVPIKLAGMQIGMTRDELYKLLDESGIGYALSEEDNVINFNWHADETVKYRAEVRFEEDAVIDIICRIR